MKLFEEKFYITDIAVAIFVPVRMGTPVHKRRAYHGLAVSQGQTVLYKFDTGEELYCHSGECVYLPRGSNYVCSLIEETGSSAGTYAINFLSNRDSESFLPQKFKVSGEILSLFERATRDFERRGEGYGEMCLSSLYRIISLIKKEKADYRPERKTLEQIKPALKYIDENFSKSTISVPYLSELVGVSEPYLRRLFISLFSVSPSVYIRNKRISLAKKLLLSGECSVTDAAFMSGFNDTAYFSREFKRSVGISPNEYVKQTK